MILCCSAATDSTPVSLATVISLCIYIYINIHLPNTSADVYLPRGGGRPPRDLGGRGGGFPKWFPLSIIKVNTEIENPRKTPKPKSDLYFTLIYFLQKSENEAMVNTHIRV